MFSCSILYLIKVFTVDDLLNNILKKNLKDKLYQLGRNACDYIKPGPQWNRRHRDTYLFQTSAEPFKHSFHVSSLFHGYDPCVIFLIDPD